MTNIFLFPHYSDFSENTRLPDLFTRTNPEFYVLHLKKKLCSDKTGKIISTSIMTMK